MLYNIHKKYNGQKVFVVKLPTDCQVVYLHNSKLVKKIIVKSKNSIVVSLFDTTLFV